MSEYMQCSVHESDNRFFKPFQIRMDVTTIAQLQELFDLLPMSWRRNILAPLFDIINEKATFYHLEVKDPENEDEI